ncbi:hypothetical protein MNBD_GAMMA22-2083 [hydrothermal vent metagenome]|uniref:Uncharacterized protein n=1 Tax=hydrothermal vent metagenome TaxID=652676 RepID=A0A3B1B9G6_9ZZZZ
MSQEKQKTDKLFDRLAGTPPGNETESNSGTQVLRTAIQAQIATQRAAEQASRDELNATQKTQMDAIKQQLLEQGLIGVANRSWFQSLQKLIFASGWERPFALAVSMMFVITIGVQLGLSPDLDPEIIVRGGATPEIITPNATKFSKQLSKSLRELGAKVLIVKINTTDLTMRVDVPRTANVAAIKKLFSDKGIKLQAYPPYRLIVKQSD